MNPIIKLSDNAATRIKEIMSSALNPRVDLYVTGLS